MSLFDKIQRFLGSDIWFLIGLLGDVPELIWYLIVDREEFKEMMRAITDDIQEYFAQF